MRRILLLALVVAISGLALACGGDDDPTATPRGASATQPSSSSGSEPTATAEEDDDPEDEDDESSPATRAPLEVGSSAEVRSEDPNPATALTAKAGKVKVTILEILDDPDASGALLAPPEGEKYWAIKVSMEASGGEIVNTGLWSLRLDNGDEISSTFALDEFGPEFTYDAIEAGESVEGLIVFQIPSDAEVAEVEGSMSIYQGGIIIFEAR